WMDQRLTLAGVTDVLGDPLAVLADLIHQFRVELPWQGATAVVFRFLELRMGAVGASKVAEFRRIDDDLRRKLRIEPTVEAVTRRARDRHAIRAQSKASQRWPVTSDTSSRLMLALMGSVMRRLMRSSVLGSRSPCSP